MLKDKKISRSGFTLIELMAAMGVFSIMMVILLTFFSNAQQAWSNCANRSMTYENARVAMNLIASDLQSIYYINQRVPFWLYRSAGTDKNDRLFFVATTVPPNSSCKSRICEIAYQVQLYGGSAPSDLQVDKNDACLMRSITGDDTSKLNYYQSTLPWAGVVAGSGTSPAFTLDNIAGNTSRESFHKLIPYVTGFCITCYDRTGATIAPDSTGNIPTAFPYSIKIELTLLDRGSWLKWKAMGGNQEDPTSDSGTTQDFRLKNERKFTKTILLGERGQ